MLFKNIVSFAVIQEKLIFRPPYWRHFEKKLSKISDNLTRYQVNLNVLKCDVASERRHKSGEVKIEFLVFSY